MVLFSRNPISGDLEAYTEEGQFIGIMGAFTGRDDEEDDANDDYDPFEELDKLYGDKPEKETKDGGPGSGNFGHKGRPGEVGGSGEGGGSVNGSPTVKSSTSSFAKTVSSGSFKKLSGNEQAAAKAILKRFRGDESLLDRIATPQEKKYYAYLRDKEEGLDPKEEYIPDTVAYDIGVSKVLPTHIGEATKNLPNGTGRTIIPDAMFGGKRSSMLAHTSKGKITREREELHRDICDGIYEGVKKPASGVKRTFYMMGGGSASGKSSILGDPKKYGLPEKGEYAKVDSDEIKKQFPEYEQQIAKGNEEGAAKYCHLESSILSDRAVKAGMDNGYEVMLDGTGDGSVDKVEGRIGWARKRHMRVEACYLTCDIKEAIRRAEERAKKEHRKVPIGVVEGTHRCVSRIFEEIAPKFDHVRLFDTNGDSPVLIAECNLGEKIKVYDQKAYKRFLNK